MRVPRPGWRDWAKSRGRGKRCGWRGVLAAAALLPVAAWAADRQPQIAVRIPLEALGVNGFSPLLLSSGASMLTVHFLDDTHLLLTYGTHGLVRRLENDPKDDQDRMLAAEIVEIPSGKVLAKTEWQAHDHARYLWSLGHGRFLLRVGNEMYEMEPLAHLESGHPFERLSAKGLPRPLLMLVSPDQNVLTLETHVRLLRKDQQWGDVPQENAPVTTLVQFFRVRGGEGSRLSLEGAGRVLTPQPLFVPMNGDGVLYAEPKGKRQDWTIRFSSFAGAEMNVGQVNSTCDPQLALVSRSEYTAVICRGATDGTVLEAFAFDGHEAWEEPLSGMDDPVYAFAPEAGRFALVRKIEAVPGDVRSGFAGSPERQELRVYQTESGDMLLKVELTPSFRTAENFDLTRDGSLAVAVHDRVLIVYKLPPPDKQDKKDIELAAKSAPPVVGEGPIKLPGAVETASVDGTVGGERPVARPGAGVAAVPGVSAAVASQPSAAARPGKATEAAFGGDAAAARRVPPTLLEPGEKPEFGKANPQPEGAPVGAGPR